MYRTLIITLIIVILCGGGYVYYNAVTKDELSVEGLAKLVQTAKPKKEASYKINVTSKDNIHLNWFEEDDTYKLRYGNYVVYFEGSRIGTMDFAETLSDLNMEVKKSKTGLIKFYYKDSEVPLYMGE